jgi:hypothetical protein
MTWERFGYICRKVSVGSTDHESISTCLNRVENDKSCDLYGGKIGTNSWPRKILDRIGGMQDENEAKKAVESYKELNLTKQFEEPMRFKRVMAYLSYVTFIFYSVVGIYQLKVTPSFIEAFENFEISIPSHLLFYQDYWGYFVLVVTIFLISALLIGFKIKTLFSFNVGLENSLIVKYFVFRNIRKSYLKVIGILEFPTLSSNQLKNQNNNPIICHLEAVRNSDMCVSREMRELIEIEMQSLLENCEKQMKIVYISVALMVVVAIFFFLVSAYSPIFILGETV